MNGRLVHGQDRTLGVTDVFVIFPPRKDSLPIQHLQEMSVSCLVSGRLQFTIIIMTVLNISDYSFLISQGA